jgi:predicted nucleotidyltransferase
LNASRNLQSPAKTEANRAKAAAYWRDVRAGLRPAPVRRRAPPSIDEIARRLEPFCRAHDIRRLEIFGSVARGKARRGSDVDLIATFGRSPGLEFFSLAHDMASILGVPVDLLTRDEVDRMTNPFRKQAILADAREILAL